ncbi:hypothetical protein K502DRAFT_368603 [Neoconidiobolus thromboides FSU 785]|nr:hypothetical protein K502DRAFT_368603 [Neoconidiobolus thromboides FSU 785]
MDIYNINEKIRLIIEYAQILYTASSLAERQKSELQLSVILPEIQLQDSNASQDVWDYSQFLLRAINNNGGNNAYLDMYCSSRFIKDIQTIVTLLKPEKLDELKKGILETIYFRRNSSKFLTTNMAIMYAIIIKSNYKVLSPGITEDLNQFLMGDYGHKKIGMILLIEFLRIIDEEEHLNNRRMVNDFRDGPMFGLFELVLGMFYDLINFSEFSYVEEYNLSYVEELLLCLKGFLTFDFMGSHGDPSEDDSGSTQFPRDWKITLIDEKFCNGFFYLYSKLRTPLSHLSIDAMISLLTLRKSLLNDKEIIDFTTNILNNFNHLLENGLNLDDIDNHHTVARAICRFRSVHHLQNITNTTVYYRFIVAYWHFSKISMQKWESYPNSVHYILRTWVKLVESSWNFIQPSSPSNSSHHHLDFHMFPTEIFSIFLDYRLKATDEIYSGDSSFEDLLCSQEHIHESLEALCTIARYRYTLSKDILLKNFDPIFFEYQNVINSSNIDLNTVDLLHSKLAWFSHIVGAFLAVRVTYHSLDEDNKADAELCSRMFSLLLLNQALLTRNNNLMNRESQQNLGKGFLYFFGKLQDTYLSDSGYKVNVVVQRLKDNNSLDGVEAILEAMVNRIYINLTSIYNDSSNIIVSSIQVLVKLTNSYAISQKLKNSNIVNHMLNYHGPDHYPFMNNNFHLKYRSQFYSCLIKLLLLNNNQVETIFDNNFKVCFEQQLLAHKNSFELTTAKVFSLSGLARDFEGMFISLTQRQQFCYIYEWFFPNYFRLFSDPFIILLNHENDSIESYSTIHSTCKLFREMCYNRSQRLLFPVASANGVILFKEFGPILCHIGNKILKWLNDSVGLNEVKRVKIIRLYFMILHRLFGGSYVCFGVFKVYKDTTVKEVLNSYFKVLVSLQLNQLNLYPKLQATYYSLLETIVIDNWIDIKKKVEGVEDIIHQSLENGIQTNNIQIVNQCCRSIESIATRLYNYPDLESPVHKFYRDNPKRLGKTLELLFLQLLLSSLINGWYFSRAILPIVILDFNFFPEFSDKLISAQVYEFQPKLKTELDELHKHMTKDLSSSSKDAFNQKLSLFIKNIKATNFPILAPSVDIASLLQGVNLNSL